jgi:hypothetical protein
LLLTGDVTVVGTAELELKLGGAVVAAEDDDDDAAGDGLLAELPPPPPWGDWLTGVELL